MQRILVEHRCEKPCPACDACRLDAREIPARVVLEARGDEIMLGGGDATRWPSLHQVLDENRVRSSPRRIWLEAPARALELAPLAELHARGLHGVLVQIEAHGATMQKALGVGDGLSVLAAAEGVGLRTQARVSVFPATLPIISRLAEELAPRLTWLEIAGPRRPSDGTLNRDLTRDDVEALERVLVEHPHVSFSAYRMIERGYLPPCAMPNLWRSRPAAWVTALASSETPNTTLAACGTCSLQRRCRFGAAQLLPAEMRSSIAPLKSEAPAPAHGPQKILPRALPRSAISERVRCTAAWTTLEVVDPDGLLRQCCSDWTYGHRGDARAERLLSLWNGPGYRAARRAMLEADEASLCKSICPRLHDGRLAARELRLVDGTPAFVENQRMIAEDIAQGRAEVRGKPLQLSIAASTYCNYDCIMCDHGRTPRRELPEEIFEELPELFPTLGHLTLLGGEPLAHPRTMQLLREVDGRAYPDLFIDFVTNGSLLTPATLKHLSRAALGAVTISVNAGTDAVYQEVQRGIPLPDLLANLDALLAFRGTHWRPFGVALSFVVQPRAVRTLVEFGELARARRLPFRLLPLNVDRDPSLDFYGDPGAVAEVLEALEQFSRWAAEEPGYLAEARAARDAILAHVAEAARGSHRHLPVVR